jgi:hypothetical protein
MKAVIGAGLPFAISLALCFLSVGIIASWVESYESEIDPIFGYVFKAGRVGHWRTEGNGNGYWTSHGVRRARLPGKSEGPPILLVGNSFTEATQVNDAEHYAHILEKELAINGKSIPVLSFGKSGCTVADYIAEADKLKMVFQPRWVIVQVAERDFGGKSWDRTAPGFARFVRAAYHGGISVVSTPLRDRGQKSFLMRTFEEFPNLIPYCLIYDRLNEFEQWVQNEKPWFHATVPESGSAGPRSMISDYPVGEEMKLLADSFDHRMTLLYLPPFDPRKPLCEGETEALFRMVAETNGIRFVSLRGKFGELASEGKSPYGFSNTRFNYGHWNAYGHEAAAQLLLLDLLKMKHGIY